VAEGGSTEVAASGGSTTMAETEKKRSTTTTVLGLYRAMKLASRRRAARREHAEVRAGGRRRAWKAFEARWRRAGGVALLLAMILK
jgi:hypothetical protein